MPAPLDLLLLTREQLEDRRNDLHVQLAAVNKRLVGMGAAGHSTLPLDQLLRQNLQPLEPSDPD